MIVADHGMAQVSAERSVDLDLLVPRADYRLIYGGPFATIAPAAGKEEAVVKALSGRHGNLSCWPKAQVPERFHYGRNARVPAVVCLADLGWRTSQGAQTNDDKGAHGFDPDAPDMAALFIANGPAFHGPRVLAKTDNVNVYPLLARLAGVTPLANDGDPRALADLATPTP